MNGNGRSVNHAPCPETVPVAGTQAAFGRARTRSAARPRPLRLAALCWALLVLLLLPACSGLSGHQATPDRPAGPVLIYTRAGCPYCAQAKQYLEAHQVPFREYDIYRTEKGNRDFKALGGFGVPIIIVGERRLDGYDENRLAELLKSQGMLGR